MSENSSGSGLGCLAPAVGIAGLIATFMLGPIDLGRSVYNGIIGDTPVLKEQLTDYVRRDIKKRNPSWTESQIEGALARELDYSFELNPKVNPQKVSIEYLWDSAEDHARSGFQRWVWTCQNDY